MVFNATGKRCIWILNRPIVNEYGLEQAKMPWYSNASKEKLLNYGAAVVREEKYGNLFQEMYETDRWWKIPITPNDDLIPANPHILWRRLGRLQPQWPLVEWLYWQLVKAISLIIGGKPSRGICLMQGLPMAILYCPYTMGDYLSMKIRTGKLQTDTPELMRPKKKVTEDQLLCE